MFHGAHLLFHDCPLQKKGFLFCAASYGSVMVVISSRTLLVVNQSNYYVTFFFSTLLLFFSLQCFIRMISFFFNIFRIGWLMWYLQQQNILFPLNKCQVEEKENWHTTEIMHPKTTFETSEIQRKYACKSSSMKNMCNMAYFFHFQISPCSV